MDDFFEQLNQFIINTTGGQAAADERKALLVDLLKLKMPKA